MQEQFIDTGQGTGVSTATLLPLVHDRSEFEATFGSSTDPVDAVVYHLFLGAMDKAEKALDKAVKKGPGPGDFRLRTLAADVQAARGDHPQAKAMYRHLLDEASGGKHEARLQQHLGKVLLAEHDYAAAAGCFAAALRMHQIYADSEDDIKATSAALRRAEENARQGSTLAPQ